MTLAEDAILEKRYRIDKLLAQTGSRATYRGFDLNLNMPVIIKEDSLQTDQAINQFKQEALVLTGLRHRALPWVIHHFSIENHQYLVVDFIEGQSPWDFVETQNKPLPEREALELAIQVCEALNHLHQQKPPIIHNDVTPQNIKIARNGNAVLVGFGIAKQGYGDSSLPLQEPPSSGFVAPERYTGPKVTPRSDMYALGATLYALVTATPPPPSLSDVKLKPLKSLNSNLNDLTVKAIAQAMQARPADRPQTIAGWQKELEYILKSKLTAQPAKASVWSAVASPHDTINLSSRSATPTTNFWLVDSTGLGYSIGLLPLDIGRSHEADIVVDDPSVALSHAYIRTDGQNCLVLDRESANGTFLNNHRLGSGWYPINSGDILILGSTRFHLTTIQPVRQMSTKAKSESILSALEEETRSAPGGEDQVEQVEQVDKIDRTDRTADKVEPSPKPAPVPARSKSNDRLLLFLIGLLLLLGGLGGVAYWLFRPTASSDVPGPPGTAGEAVSTPTAAAAADEPVAQLQSSPAETSPAVASTPTEVTVAEPSPTSETSVAATRQATAIITDSLAAGAPPPASTTTLSPSTTALPSATATLSTAAATLTSTTATPPPLTRTLTATRAVTPTLPAATPTVSGPTVIPLEAGETVEQLGRQEVIDVDINPQNPVEVYALVKQEGIYKSSQAGAGPWGEMPLDASGAAAFILDPTNPARFYAPTWNAVLKSTDGGNSWAANSNGLLANQTVNVVAVDPVEPAILYAGVGENLVVSTDSGQTWTSLGYGEGLGVSKLHSIVVDPFDHNTVYVAGLAGSIYKSTNAGNTFSQLPGNIGQGAYSFVAHPTQPDVYLAGVNSANAAILKTENGRDFRSVSDGLVFGGADSPYSAIAYAPSNPSVVYAGSGAEDNRLAKGVFKSTDGGETWRSINEDLPRNPVTGQPYYVKSIVVHPTNPDIVFAATGAGLYKSVDGGQSWELL